MEHMRKSSMQTLAGVASRPPSKPLVPAWRRRVTNGCPGATGSHTAVSLCHSPFFAGSPNGESVSAGEEAHSHSRRERWWVRGAPLRTGLALVTQDRKLHLLRDIHGQHLAAKRVGNA